MLFSRDCDQIFRPIIPWIAVYMVHMNLWITYSQYQAMLPVNLIAYSNVLIFAAVMLPLSGFSSIAHIFICTLSAISTGNRFLFPAFAAHMRSHMVISRQIWSIRLIISDPNLLFRSLPAVPIIGKFEETVSDNCRLFIVSRIFHNIAMRKSVFATFSMSSMNRCPASARLTICNTGLGTTSASLVAGTSDRRNSSTRSRAQRNMHFCPARASCRYWQISKKVLPRLYWPLM